jgi:predicted Holliday junction resolvase-like endonuclease
LDFETIVPIALGVVAGTVIALVYVAVWKWRYTARVRRDAIAQSKAVTRGQVYEQLVPFLPEFPFNPKDAHFLGKPVDFIVFDGLEEGDLRQVVLVEVKTGNATLTPRERQVRDAIREKRVQWAEIRQPGTDAVAAGLPRAEVGKPVRQ